MEAEAVKVKLVVGHSKQSKRVHAQKVPLIYTMQLLPVSGFYQRNATAPCTELIDIA